MYERTIGAKLSLIADFARASEQATENLTKIQDGIEKLKTAGARFDLSGLTEMGTQLQTLETRANAAASSVRSLNTALGPTAARSKSAAENIAAFNQTLGSTGSVSQSAAGRVEEFVNVTGRVSPAARRARADLSEMTGCIRDIQGAATGAAQSLLRLQTAATLLGGSRVIINQLGQAFIETSTTALVARASVLSLEAALMRLPRNREIRIEVVSNMLPGGSGSPYQALTGGVESPIYSGGAVASGGLPQGALPGGSQLMLPGGTDPNFNARAWWAQWRANNPGTSGGGPAIPMGGGGGGFGSGGGGIGGGVQGFGNSMSHMGNNMFWGGFSGVMVSSMIAGPMEKMVKEATDLDDMLHMTAEALGHAGATPDNAKKFSDRIAKLSETVGGDFNQNIAGIYPFVSSLPTYQAGLNLNDKKTQDKLANMYKSIMQLHQVDVSSGSPSVDQYQLALDVAATAKNLGFQMNNVDETEKAYIAAANILVQIKNKTASTAGQAAQAFKQVGVIAANSGIDPQELVGIIGALGENKILAGQAGNQTRRILSRQAMDPKAVAKLQEAISDATGGQFNLSMYDPKTHQQRGINELIAQLATVEQRGDHGKPISDQGRAKIEGTLAGLYAGPALGAIVRFATQGAGKDGKPITPESVKAYLQEYAHDLITKLPAGAKPGTTPLQATTDIRQNNNVKTAAQETDAVLKNTLLNTFSLLKPDIIEILKLIGGFAKAFNDLPDPIKKGAIEFAAFAATIAGAVGIGGMFLGSLLKLGGGFIWVVGGIARVVQYFGLVGQAVRFLGAAFLGVPVIGWITAIVIAAALLYEAWTHDWGGIREKTAAALEFIGQKFNQAKEWFKDLPAALQKELPKIPAQLGWIVGRVAAWVIEMQLKAAEFALTFPARLADAFTKVWTFLSGQVPKWIEAGATIVRNIVVGFVQGIPGAVKRIGDGLAEIQANIIGWAGGLVSSGQKAGSQFVDGVVQGTKAGVPRVKAANQGIADLYPHSEPKDSTSPLAGITKSGETFGSMFIDGVVFGLDKGKEKVKKAAKPVADVFMTLRHESVAQVEAMAKEIERNLEQNGAVIKDRWIELLNPVSGAVTRTYGDPAAYRAAITGATAHDQSYQKASDYAKSVIDQWKMNPAAVMQADIDELVKKILSFKTQALTDHVKNEINHLAAGVKEAADTASRKIDAAFKKMFAPFSKDQTEANADLSQLEKYEQRFSNIESRYDQKLQNQVQMQKNPNWASPAELNSQRSTEITEERELNDLMQEETLKRDQLSAVIDKMTADISNMNATTDQEKLAKQAAIDQLMEYSDQLDDVNTKLQTQTLVIQKLNTTIDAYTQKISQAKQKNTEWAQVLGAAIPTAVKAAQDAFTQGADNIVDRFVDRILGNMRGKQSIFQQAFSAFFHSLFNSIVNSLIGSMFSGLQAQVQGWMSKIGIAPTGANSAQQQNTDAVSQNTNSLHAMQPSIQTALPNSLTGVKNSVDPNTTATNSNTNALQANTSAMQSKGGSGNQSAGFGIPGYGQDTTAASIGVSLEPQSGNTDLGQAIVDNTNTDKNKDHGGPVGEDGKSGPPPDAKTAPKIGAGNILSAATSAYSVYDAFSPENRGTVGGAVQAGFGTYNTLSQLGVPPQIAIPVAIGVGLIDLFSHHVDPATMPDVYDTNRYGQTTADLLGAQAGANGQTFYPDKATVNAMQSFGTTTGVGAVQKWLSMQNPNSPPPGMSQQQWAALLGQWTGEFGSNPAGTGTLIHPDPNNIGIEEVTNSGPGAKGGNSQQSYTTLGQSMSQIEQLMQATEAAMLQAQQNAAALAASFTTLLLNGPQGFLFPGALSGSNKYGNTGNPPGGGWFRRIGGGAGGGSGSGGSGEGGGSGYGHGFGGGGGYGHGDAQMGGEVHIHVLPNVTELHGGDEMRVAIREAIPEISDHVAKNWHDKMRVRGDYVSFTRH